jgi:thiamine-phosphate pyrophosphorylase
MSLRLPSPLYAILDVDVAAARGLAAVDVLSAWLDAGVRLVQLRAKALPSGEFLDLADQMAARCREAGALFIINDRADIAVMARADGVHVGQQDLAPAAARAMAGAEAWVGVSTHTDEQMAAACLEPVSYVAIGPVFSTSTKAQPDPTVGLDGVRRAARLARASGLPLVAIGGITRATAAGVIAAGADAVAVISDLTTADPGSRAREFLAGLRL